MSHYSLDADKEERVEAVRDIVAVSLGVPSSKITNETVVGICVTRESQLAQLLPTEVFEGGLFTTPNSTFRDLLLQLGLANLNDLQPET